MLPTALLAHASHTDNQLVMCLQGWNTHASLLTAAPALAEL
jgi:hypothetical protein